MRKTGLAFAFIVVVFFAAPPTVYADECYVSTFRTLIYYPSCGCRACAGFALTNCTECTDGNGHWCQTTSTQQHCEPWVNNW